MSIDGHAWTRPRRLVAGALLAAATGPAHAVFSTGFTIPDEVYPDLFASDLSLDYSVSGGGASVLRIEDTVDTFFTWTEFDGASALPIGVDSLLLEASFTSNGSVLESGSLSIYGGGLAFTSIPANTLLLSGDIFDFAVEKLSGDTGNFFFRLKDTRSDASEELGWNVPARGQFVMNASGLSNSNWATGGVAFTGVGTADTGVPSPTTIALLGIGLIGLQWMRSQGRGVFRFLPARSRPKAARVDLDSRTDR